jgi:hypothetical protein
MVADGHQKRIQMKAVARPMVVCHDITKTPKTLLYKTNRRLEDAAHDATLELSFAAFCVSRVPAHAARLLANAER